MLKNCGVPLFDAFAIFLDPYNDQTNGMSFGVNPYGVQREGELAEGGGFGVSTAWDNRWFAEVSRSKEKWIVD